jgi:hypothetical protein
LIVRVPPKWRKLAMPDRPEAVAPGTVNDDLIAFVDFAPTMLSLATVEIPSHMQGHAFLGPRKARPREYVFAARDRMDEAYDLIRAVRDKRFKYIRNYMWYVWRAQDIRYMNEMPTMQEMRRLHAEGKLDGPQKQYFEPIKPIEELYDVVADPHEVRNLAGDPACAEVLERLRRAHEEWYKDTQDVGLIPEPVFDGLKRPNGQYEKTTPPVVVKRTGDAAGGASVTLACATAGASIAYRVGGDPQGKTGWLLYSRPVPLKPGDVLHARAATAIWCRSSRALPAPSGRRRQALSIGGTASTRPTCVRDSGSSRSWTTRAPTPSIPICRTWTIRDRRFGTGR